ncbi:uncharacterized protein LOC131234308 isoform X1 [Magnolia sinica]|uniref:uncharacterized protein LOC131234308 isoform X1 n=1 Tax=Magnolia sinica TaxID=86752 RepID=UPI00265B3042|nr:uncharacterized protein LOC131234308 isoform X1 [Magnolia sinica]
MVHYGRSRLNVCSLDCWFASLVTVVLVQVPWASSIVVPSSNCYVLDNSSHIYDFTDWIGHLFEYNGQGSETDFAVRFCKDVESRSQKGYVDFGRFTTSNNFVAGSGHVNFVQGFFNGDLLNCEGSFDKMGRTAEVNITCGDCLNKRCKGGLGCICNVAYDLTMCRAFVELAIPCGKQGLRVFEGFTVGFHPRSWEVVYNGLTQIGFEKARHEFSFGTGQTRVSLYMTAISALSCLVGKPVLKFKPDKGLDVKLSVSAANGSPPTTLSPSILNVDWRCEKACDAPYEVVVSIPVEGYEPIEFTLTKICEYRQEGEGDATRGWATFGVLSCVFIVLSTVFCCGGFIYRTRVEHQHGLDALPGMTILSACLETVSGRGTGGYSPVDDSAFINRTSWEHVPVSGQGTQRTSRGKYGTI